MNLSIPLILDIGSNSLKFVTNKDPSPQLSFPNYLGEPNENFPQSDPSIKKFSFLQNIFNI